MSIVLDDTMRKTQEQFFGLVTAVQQPMAAVVDRTVQVFTGMVGKGRPAALSDLLEMQFRLAHTLLDAQLELAKILIDASARLVPNATTEDPQRAVIDLDHVVPSGAETVTTPG
jgi:hypothetical protein